MKMVINANYGGYSIPDEFLEEYGIGELDYDMYELRTDPRFIEWVERERAAAENDDDKWDEGFDLAVVEIPDEATDYEIDEYDGYESVIAVVDGKIIHIS